MIKVSNNAKAKLMELITEDKSYLRVGVKGGGCSGLSYILEFDDKVNKEDEFFEDNGIKIICDKKSLLYIFGTELDYSGGLNGKGFEWINPNVKRVCGCGNSFSL